MAKGTKSLNPADKARKEARKKELKKNKKQRHQVRSEVIERCDPEQVLAELEGLDKEEYESTDEQKKLQQKSAIGNLDLLFKEKRKRLRALLTRILTHYEKEDPERFSKLKKREAEYELKHRKAEKDYDAIKAAREVKIDDVILPPEPDFSDVPDLSSEINNDHPLMSESIYVTPLTEGLHPPGCPPGPPPSLKLLAEQLEAALCVPLNDFMAPHMQYLNQPPPRLGSSGRHKQAPPNNNKIARYSSSQNQTSKRNKRELRPPPEASAASSLVGKPTGQLKQAVIESKPILFVPKSTKFVPASVRSKVLSKAKEKNKPPNT